MFLYTARHAATNRNVQTRFQHSGETISRCFHEVLSSLVSPLICKRYVTAAKNNTPTPPEIKCNPKMFPYFKDAIGAVDGSHIPAVVPLKDQPRFQDREKNIIQNVMIICSFDLKIMTCLAGWEGSAADGNIWHFARSSTLRVPKDRYFLADAGYGLSKNLLTPYRSVRYHLKEWEKGNLKPVNAKELFNLRYAQARNVVERTLGVLKRQYAILVHMRSFSFPTQARLIHNFILTYEPSEISEFDPTAIDNEIQNSFSCRGTDVNGDLGQSSVTSQE